ncbi:unnamed protein product [Caenorhabditis nigoni]
MFFFKLQTITDQNNQVMEMVSSMKSQISNLERKIVSGKPNENSKKPSEQSIIDTSIILNAADYLKGASVDNAQSSRTNLNPLIGFDQTNLVLLDRPQPPTHKAWCSNEHNPVLTINLAKYIKPISVSYQHSKWTHNIPMSTPRTYDVVVSISLLDSHVSLSFFRHVLIPNARAGYH